MKQKQEQHRMSQINDRQHGQSHIWMRSHTTPTKSIEKACIVKEDEEDDATFQLLDNWSIYEKLENQFQILCIHIYNI